MSTGSSSTISAARAADSINCGMSLRSSAAIDRGAGLPSSAEAAAIARLLERGSRTRARTRARLAARCLRKRRPAKEMRAGCFSQTWLNQERGPNQRSKSTNMGKTRVRKTRNPAQTRFRNRKARPSGSEIRFEPGRGVPKSGLDEPPLADGFSDSRRRGWSRASARASLDREPGPAEPLREVLRRHLCKKNKVPPGFSWNRVPRSLCEEYSTSIFAKKTRFRKKGFSRRCVASPPTPSLTHAFYNMFLRASARACCPLHLVYVESKFKVCAAGPVQGTARAKFIFKSVAISGQAARQKLLRASSGPPCCHARQELH